MFNYTELINLTRLPTKSDGGESAFTQVANEMIKWNKK